MNKRNTFFFSKLSVCLTRTIFGDAYTIRDIHSIVWDMKFLTL